MNRQKAKISMSL
jgi:zinc transporter 1/2/3